MSRRKKQIYHNLKQIAFLYSVKFLLWWQKFTKEEKKYLKLPPSEKKLLLHSQPELKNTLFARFPEPERVKLFKRNVKKREFYRKQKKRTWIGGRGSAKTNTIGKLIRQLFAELPGGIAGLAALTFTHIENNILPEVFFALNSEGIFENKHFVYGHKPPKTWKQPIRQVKDYTHVISFNNGFCIALLSEYNPKVNRGISLDALIVDEAGFAKPDWIRKVLLPTVRANRYSKIAKSPLHWGRFMFTSAPDTLEGQFIYEYEELAKKNPDEYFYIESTPYDNLDALPPNYIQDLQNTLTQVEFDVEVMNKRLQKLPNAFYPSYDEKVHLHEPYGYRETRRKDGNLIKSHLDYNENKIIEISLDRNAKFSCMTISQMHGKDCWFINVMWVKFQTIYKLIENFCEQYKDHKERNLHLYGDRNLYEVDKTTGIRYIDTIISKLASHKKKWIVHNKVSPQNLEHSIKHLVINTGLEEKLPSIPKIRINRLTCRALHLSIANAPILDDFHKNKESERKNIEQEKATHLSDAFDYRIYPLFVAPVLRGSDEPTSSETFFG